LLQKKNISNKYCSHELYIHQRVLKKVFHGFHKKITVKKNIVGLTFN